MRKTIYILLLSIALISCGSTLPPDYQIDAPRIISVKIENPEVSIDPAVNEEIKLSILVAGKGVDQNMTQNVYWMADPMSGNVESPLAYPYNKPLTVTTQQVMDIAMSGSKENQIPAILPDYIDFPITGAITVKDKDLYFAHKIRFTKIPKHFNPGITGIELMYPAEPINEENSENKFIKTESKILDKKDNSVISFKDDVPDEVDDVPDFFIAKILLKDKKETGNVKHIYSWYISRAHESDNDNEVLMSSGKFKLALFDKKGSTYKEQTVSVGDSKESAFFRLKKDGEIQSGTYDVYIVVRDKNTEATSVDGDHYGQDFHYFQICVGDACKSQIRSL